MNESFTFYGSFTDALDLIPDKEVKYEVMEAIISYGSKGIIPDEISPYAKAMFALIKPNIDTNLKKRAGGAKGGRPKKETIEAESESHMVSKTEKHRFSDEETMINQTSGTEADQKEGPEKKDKPVKHKYGEYKNVLLTDEEVEKLKEYEPNYEKWIEVLSRYIGSHGKKYKSHYITIRNWIRKDREEGGGNNAVNAGNSQPPHDELFADQFI